VVLQYGKQKLVLKFFILGKTLISSSHSKNISENVIKIEENDSYFMIPSINGKKRIY
jgi:hypothetical protein